MNPLRYPKSWTVYLLHIDPPVHGKRHYIGIARRDNLERRLSQHAHGSGSHLTRAAVLHRSTLTLVRLWHDVTHDFERRLKVRGHAATLCTICTPSLEQQIDQQRRELLQPRWGTSTFAPTNWTR